MKTFGPKTKQVLALLLLLIALIATWWVLSARKGPSQTTPGTTVVQDQQAGLSVNMPNVYRPYESKRSTHTDLPTGLIGNYVRSDPTAYLTLRYDTGLTAVTNLLRRGTLEHIEAEIANFFPAKYGSSYRAIETKHVQITDRESIDHQFSYTSSSGEDLQVRLLAIPYSQDAAYYLILQAPTANFPSVMSDLDALKDSLKLTGPQPPAQSS